MLPAMSTICALRAGPNTAKVASAPAKMRQPFLEGKSLSIRIGCYYSDLMSGRRLAGMIVPTQPFVVVAGGGLL